MVDEKLYYTCYEISSQGMPVVGEAGSISYPLSYFLSEWQTERTALFEQGRSFVFQTRESKSYNFKHADISLIIGGFYSRNYLFDQQSPVLIISKESQDKNKLFFEELDRVVKAQGWRGLKLLISDRENRTQTGLKYITELRADEQQVFEIYKDVIDSEFFVLIRGSSMEEVKRIDFAFNEKLNLELTKRGVYELALRLFNLTISDKRQADKISEMDGKLKAANEFVEIAKTKYKDDYEQLFRFYHGEYELLPAWYKRFGHILKWIIGKRSFKSMVKK